MLKRQVHICLAFLNQELDRLSPSISCCRCGGAAVTPMLKQKVHICLAFLNQELDSLSPSISCCRCEGAAETARLKQKVHVCLALLDQELNNSMPSLGSESPAPLRPCLFREAHGVFCADCRQQPVSGTIAPNQSRVRCREVYVLRARHFAPSSRTVSAISLFVCLVCGPRRCTRRRARGAAARYRRLLCKKRPAARCRTAPGETTECSCLS